MFNRFTLLLLVGFVFSGVCSDAQRLQAVPPAAEKQLAAAIALAERDVEAAQLRLRLYEQVERPRRQRQLDNEINLAAAEVARLRALLAEYKQITSRTIPEPLILTRQQTELALMETEFRLDDLREENLLLMRFGTDQCRLHQIDVEAAIARWRALVPER